MDVSCLVESYWCSYCGEPTDRSDFVKSWRFQSPKGGKVFTVKIFKCENCGKKFRITEPKEDKNKLIVQEKLMIYGFGFAFFSCL